MPLAWVVIDEISEVAIDLARREVPERIGSTQTIVTTNGPAFAASAYGEFFKSSSVQWRPVSGNAPHAKDRDEWVLGLFKMANMNVSGLK